MSKCSDSEQPLKHTTSLENYLSFFLSFHFNYQSTLMKNCCSSFQYPCCSHPFSTAQFSFLIHRRALYFIYNVILPCTALIVIVLMSFFLPPDSGERISIVITVLLALCIFLQVLLFVYILTAFMYQLIYVAFMHVS